MQYMKKLRREIENLDFQIEGHERTISVLIEKRAELLAVEETLIENGFIPFTEGEQAHE